MPIPFPKLHIAESAINRILNAMDDIEPMLSIQPAPIAPASPIALGQQIEEETATPTPDVELPPAGTPEGDIAAESLMGGSPFDGALVNAFGGNTL